MAKARPANDIILFVLQGNILNKNKNKKLPQLGDMRSKTVKIF